MTTTEWLVIGGGVVVLVFLNWYFLFAERGKPKAGNDLKPPRNDA
jgi:hypothetical protein